MGIGVGIFLIAVGAILTFAVHVTTTGFNIHTVGVILMIAGALGLIVTMTIFAPRRRASTVQERTVSRDPSATKVQLLSNGRPRLATFTRQKSPHHPSAAR
jgi:uncharacterized membrane protein